MADSLNFTLSFDTTTPAFSYDRIQETARILRQTADAVLSGGLTTVRDLNGTDVGTWNLPILPPAPPVEEPTPGS
jgi:hypothetical protein